MDDVRRELVNVVAAVTAEVALPRVIAVMRAHVQVVERTVEEHHLAMGAHAQLFLVGRHQLDDGGAFGVGGRRLRVHGARFHGAHHPVRRRSPAHRRGGCRSLVREFRLGGASEQRVLRRYGVVLVRDGRQYRGQYRGLRVQGRGDHAARAGRMRLRRLLLQEHHRTGLSGQQVPRRVFAERNSALPTFVGCSS